MTSLNTCNDTDGLYSIAGFEGQRRGRDVIGQEVNERYYLVDERDAELENLLCNYLGEQAVLTYLGKGPSSCHVYRVPYGAQLLSNVLESGQFSPAYVDTLKAKAETLLGRIRELDPACFGVTLHDVALISCGFDDVGDDACLTVVPPLSRSVGVDSVER